MGQGRGELEWRGGGGGGEETSSSADSRSRVFFWCSPFAAVRCRHTGAAGPEPQSRRTLCGHSGRGKKGTTAVAAKKEDDDSARSWPQSRDGSWKSRDWSWQPSQHSGQGRSSGYTSWPQTGDERTWPPSSSSGSGACGSTDRPAIGAAPKPRPKPRQLDHPPPGWRGTPTSSGQRDRSRGALAERVSPKQTA